MSQKIFRDVSIEKLTSPEQLDKLVKVTSPLSWVVLLAIGILLLSTIIWGVWGSIPEIIYGNGILLDDGKVFTVYSHTSGQITDVFLKVGATVSKGDVIAKAEIPHLEDRIKTLQRGINRMKAEGKAGTAEYIEINRELEELQKTLENRSVIISPINGRIIELNIHTGRVFVPGAPLVVIDEEGDHIKLQAIVFIPLEEAGIILPGMEVQVSPTIYNKEKYGFLLGRVSYVSDYPDTTQNILHTLGNERLVEKLTGQMVPIRIEIDLLPDKNSESGYMWSSPKGSALDIHSGILIQSAIIIHRERPINKVIPIFNNSK